MPITEILEKNASWYADDVALVEINPEQRGVKKGTWKEYDPFSLEPKDKSNFSLVNICCYGYFV